MTKSDRVLIRIINLPESGHFQEFDLRAFRVGSRYELGHRLAEVLILMGYAEPQPSSRENQELATRSWTCPFCGIQVRYEDYNRAFGGETWRCHGCAVELIIDRGADKPVGAVGAPRPKPRKPL